MLARELFLQKRQNGVFMNNYLKPLITVMKANINTVNATKMKSYMRNKFDYLGIKSPQRREIMRDFIKEYGKPQQIDLTPIVEELWQLPQREFQYCAMDILIKNTRYLTKEDIELVEHLIMTKSWWDTVDLLASNLVGKLFQKFPELQEQYLPNWLESGNIWLQRTCLIFQLHYKKNTDVNLLFELIDKLKDTDEFFLNKAIGWALRQYSKTDATAVIDFVRKSKLAALSQREALKWLKKTGKIV